MYIRIRNKQGRKKTDHLNVIPYSMCNPFCFYPQFLLI